MPQTPIPVTVLTGFLGSGKTTLLNRILTEQHGQRIAVIENEFGEIGIDHALVINADEEIFEMNNGCICCTVRGDLIRILGRLVQRRHRFDRVIIETTGMADPGPVAQTFFVDDDIREQFTLDAIITLVDSHHVEHHLEDSDEVRAQIAFADVLLLNKIDLVDDQRLQRLEQRLQAMNGMAQLHRTELASIPLERILAIGGFDLQRALTVNPEFLKPEYPFEWAGAFQLTAGNYTLSIDTGPDPSLGFVLMPLPAATQDSLQQAAEQVYRRFSQTPEPLTRGAVVATGSTYWELQPQSQVKVHLSQAGCYGLFTQHRPEEFALELLAADASPQQPVVCLDFAPSHSHDDSVGSVGIVFPGALNPNRLSQWLSELLQTRGQDIFRMKGILDIAGEHERFVFQGVHMLFDGSPGGAWGREERVNRMIFIGRNLERAELEQGLRGCLA